MSTPQPAASKVIEDESDTTNFSDEDCCEFEIECNLEDTDTNEGTEDDTENDQESRRWVKQPRSLQKFIGHR